MKNATSTSTSHKTLTAAMLVLGMSFGTAASLAPATADAAAAAKKKEARFEVKVDGPKKAIVGKATTYMVSLVPIKPWHTNTDFPTSLALKAPAGVKLKKSSLKKKDAKVLSEQEIKFEVQVTASKPGKQNITGKMKFAICKNDSCSPAKTAVSIPVVAAKK